MTTKNGFIVKFAIRNMMTTEHGFSIKSGFTEIWCTPNFPLPLEQEKIINLGRIHPESTSNPVITSDVRNVFPSLSQTSPIEPIFGDVGDKFAIFIWDKMCRKNSDQILV